MLFDNRALTSFVSISLINGLSIALNLSTEVARMPDGTLIICRQQTILWTFASRTITTKLALPYAL